MRAPLFLLLTAVLGIASLVPVGCSPSIDVGSDAIEGGSGSFASEDGSFGPDASLPALCASNTCPAGRVTCPTKPYPCGVDPMTDDDNCGGCGIQCRAGAPHSNMRCVKGACELVCETGYGDCNGLLDDGCELLVSGPLASDKENCGACGKACDVCIKGICGCPAGETLCPDQKCHDLKKENNNCNACGNVCSPSTDPPFPSEWHAGYGCSSGTCNRPVCFPGYSDCNQDFGNPAGDGCEIFTAGDPMNCGGCGAKCAAGETCFLGTCVCNCGSICFTAINSDIDNCGLCNYRCPGSRGSLTPTARAFGLDVAHGKPVCDQGVCDYTCTRGWADCDGDLESGCETNLLDDPFNCGACGARCNGIEGQACIEGKCLMKECGVR